MCNQYSAAGITPQIISIGNEISSGFLWPLGHIKTPQNLAELLHCASNAIKHSSLLPQPKIMIHTDNGWDKKTQLTFFKKILSMGAFSLSDFDVIGLSVYPFFSAFAKLSAIRKSLEALQSTYKDKLIMIAETDWPVSCPAVANNFPSDTKHIPISVEGQIIWMKALVDILDSLTNGVGICYWEPAWLNNWALGSKCNDSLLFEPSGRARSSVDVFSII